MNKIDVKGVIVPNDSQWIYDLFEMESTSPKKVSEALANANGADVEVIINSPGGDVFAGSEIYTELKSYSGNVVNKIVGVAASAASIIAMSGKTLISPTAQMMIHNASSFAGGDHRDLKHASDFLHNWDKSLSNAYILKSGMSQEELLDLMNKETWFNAHEALEKKLVDEIMFEDNQPQLVANIGGAMMIPKQVIDTIRNMKDTFNPANPNKKDEVDIFNQQKATAKLNLLKLGGITNEL